MKYTFTASGHPNILATHRSTIEITKDSELSKKGDCIVAVGADFSLLEIRQIIGISEKIRLTIAVAGIEEGITAVANRNFSSDHEIVLRTGGFLSERTLGTRADRAAADLSRILVSKLAAAASEKVEVTLDTA